MKMNSTVLALAAAAAAAAFALPAQAIVIVGTTAGGSTWNRPQAGTPPTLLSGVGTAVPYTMLPFTVSTTGSYVFQSTSTAPALWDNFVVLYQNAFSAAAPLANAVVANDDNTTIGLAGFTSALTAGTSYFLITTGFGNLDFGGYSNSITGPGTISVVPEPVSVVLLGLGLAAVLTRTRRRETSAA